MASPTQPTAEVHNSQAQAMFRARRFDDAITGFRAAIALRASYPEAHLGLANALAALGRFEDAAAAYRRAIPLNPRMPQPHNNLGSALMALGKTEDAIDAFQAAITSANGAYPEAEYNLGLALARLGRWDEAMTAYQSALRQRPRPEIHNNIGVVHTNRDSDAEAIAAFQTAIAIQPSYPEAHYNLGSSFARLKRWQEAAEAFRKAAALRPAMADAHRNLGTALLESGRPDEAISAFRQALAQIPHFAAAHSGLGNALSALGRLTEAVEAYRSAIAAHPEFPEAHCNLGTALHGLGRSEEALAATREAVRLKPDFAAAYNNLSIFLLDMGAPPEALEAARRAFDLAPGVANHHLMLGNALRDCDRPDDAIVVYRKALEQWPNEPEILSVLANLLLLRHGRGDAEAHELLSQAVRLRPLARRPANKAKADFSVLLINAPGVGNTPVDYLLARSNYDCAFVLLLPDVDYDLALLRQHGDVVVNLVSDVDSARDLLPQVEDLLSRLGRPVVNHPSDILKTGREQVAGRLENIPNCHTPIVVRRTRAELTGAELTTIAGLAFPLLVRVPGEHGGELFEKLEDIQAVRAFVDRYPRADYYLSEYVPYASADGYFRKYRFIAAGEMILPYHLAIGDQWKVHYFSTDMVKHEWMRREEEAFLSTPTAVFHSAQWQALEAIRETIGLDYFGIDCALDKDGNVLVFEANATMLVHWDRGIFAYKQPAISRIKQAFDDLLAKATRGLKSG